MSGTSIGIISEITRDDGYKTMMADFNRMAATGDRHLLRQFIETYSPLGVIPNDGGQSFQLTQAEDPVVWFVQSDMEAYGVLLPGAHALKNWEKIYRHMSALKAKEAFNGYYEVTSGADTLSVDTAAWARRTGDLEFETLQAGKLRG